MVSKNGAALLAFWATLVPTFTVRGANIMDPTVKRRLGHRQITQPATRESVAQGVENRPKRLGAPQPSSSSVQKRGLQNDACVLQGNIYGNFVGNPRSVEFLYQGVFAEGTSQTQIIQNILSNLEREMVTGILPAFFDCPGTDPTGVVNGISPTDDDSLSVGGTYPIFVLLNRMVSFG